MIMKALPYLMTGLVVALAVKYVVPRLPGN